MLRSPARGQLPKLAFLVVNRAACRPRQQRGVDVADALAAAGRGNDDAMLGSVMTQVMRLTLAIGPATDIHAVVLLARDLGQQAASANIGFGLEPSRAMHACVLFRATAY